MFVDKWGKGLRKRIICIEEHYIQAEATVFFENRICIYILSVCPIGNIVKVCFCTSDCIQLIGLLRYQSCG